MNKIEYLHRMKFPKEWQALEMYPDDLFNWQLSGYRPEHEEAPEHDRNGAFHWWLRRNPSKDLLEKLLILASLDPDPHLGNDVRHYIELSACFDEALAALARNLFKQQPSR